MIVSMCWSHFNYGKRVTPRRFMLGRVGTVWPRAVTQLWWWWVSAGGALHDSALCHATVREVINPNVCNSAWLRRQAESNPWPLAWQASTLPVPQRGNFVGKASTYTACSTSLCYILPCQISVRPLTPGTVSTVRVLTTMQLLYNIESPHREDSQFLSPVPLDRQLSCQCHSHQGAFSNLPCSRYSTCTNGAVLLRPLFHTCTDITALWWSHFGRHFNSGWLRRQAESNPWPLAWQASALPVPQRGNLIGKASTYTACSTSLCYM